MSDKTTTSGAGPREHEAEADAEAWGQIRATFEEIREARRRMARAQEEIDDLGRETREILARLRAA